MRLKQHISAGTIRESMCAGGGVGFVFHATDWDTLHLSFEGVPAGRSAGVDEYLWSHPPFIGSPITLHGHVIGANIIAPVPAELWARLPSTIRRFRENHFNACLKLARECGLRVVALGALTPYACDYGRAPREDALPTVTTGHAATAVTLAQTVELLSARVGVPLRGLRLALFGAAGMMGGATLRALAGLGCEELILVDFAAKHSVLARRRAEHLSESPGSTSVSCAPYLQGAELPEFDGAVLVTSSMSPFLTGADLRRAKFWVDDSHPRAASEAAEHETRGDTLYVECYTRGPAGLDVGYPFRLPSPRDCYSCFAEGFVSWAEGDTSDFVTGPPTGATLERTARLLAKHGFGPGPLVSKSGLAIAGD